MLPAVSAATSLDASFTAGSIAAPPFAATGHGLFVGFYAGVDVNPDWRLTSPDLVVDLTTLHYTAVGAGGKTLISDIPKHSTDSSHYTAATVTQDSLAQNSKQAHKFWLIVTPASSGKSFQVDATLPGQGFQAKTAIAYDSQPDATSLVAKGSPNNVNHLTYSAPDPAIEWVSPVTSEVRIQGDFILRVFQSDFHVADSQGRNDAYSTGDHDPGTTLPAIYEYTQSSANLTVRGGTLTLVPNARIMQIDLAKVDSTVGGNLLLRDARGTVTTSQAELPFQGDMSIQADRIALSLSPLDGRFATHLSGTVQGMDINGQPLRITPSTSPVALPVASPWATEAVTFAGLAAAIIAGIVIRRSRTQTTLLVARAQVYLDIGQAKRALSVCRRILRRTPGHADASTVAAMSLIQLGRAAEARPLLERSRELHGDQDGLLPVMESLVLYHQGEVRTAWRELEKAFAEHPALEQETMAADLLDQLRVRMALAPVVA